MKFAIGDRVRYSLSSSGTGVVIGYPNYSKDKTVVMLSDEGYHGMPINEKWCERLSETDIEKALRLRKRYNSLYPNFLQAEEDDS